MFRTSHIRTKLAMALAIPLVALVLLSAFEVKSARDDLAKADRQADLASGSVGPGSLLVHLQDERNRAAIDLIGLGAAANLPVKDNKEARSLTDPATTDFRDATGGTGAVGEAFAPAWKALDGDLAALRDDIDAYNGPRDSTNLTFADQVFARYSTIIEAFFDGTSRTALQIDDTNLRNGASVVDASTRSTDVLARIVRGIVQSTIAGTLDDAATHQEIAALSERLEGFDRDIAANSTGIFTGVGDATYAEPDLQSFRRQVDGYLAGQAVSIDPLLNAVASDPNNGYSGLQDRATKLLAVHAQQLQDDAAARERLFTGVALASLLLALLTTWIVSRSITRPLHSLRDQAEDMAGTRLPRAVRQILDTPPGDDVVMPEVEPITVKTKDEVAEVAAALSAVQASAVDLAVEQAVLRRNISDSYVNLGRRNQNLLSRQLDFITDLERNETDPDTLEGLFRLDHLATRMRRNAESLLVLAGIDPPRQWSAPVKIADVIRAALGEVEDYQRVVVRHLEPASATGQVAADVAHVLAELIENALSFSPPEQSVEVKGRLTTSGYTIAITDNGLGMNAQEVAVANRRLAGKESFTVAPSRYLGHYVAGHLASRLGVVVELQDSPAGGITARVDLPMGLLADDELTGPIPTPSVQPEPVAVPTSTGSTIPATEGPIAVTAGGLPRRGTASTASVAEEVVAPAPIEPSAPAAPLIPPAPPAPAVDLPVRPAHLAPVDSPLPPPPPFPEPVVAGAPSAQAPTAETADAGDSLLPGIGFGGLAVTNPGPSMWSAAASGNGLPVRPPAEANGNGTNGGSSTFAGLTRRVPGAQRPDAGLAAREAEVDPAEEPVRTTPEDVYSFLSNFQSGVARGRADAANGATEPQEEAR